MTEVSNITLALYAQTDVGMVRSGNEDNFLILDLSTGQSWIANEEENTQLLTYGQGYYGALLAVSDGMGGALAGEVASRMAVETVRDRMLQLQAHESYGQLPFAERLRLAIEEANLLIKEEGEGNPSRRGLGATFTAAAVLGDHIYFAQVGDSRAHLLRNGEIVRTTKDQSLVQQLIDAGQITEEEAENHQYKNVILQALGAHNHVNVEVGSLPLRQYDTLLLCSDGLSGKVHTDEIGRIVEDAPDLKSACHQLVALANERGGEDNITVVIAQFSGTGLLPPEVHDSLIPDLIPRSQDIPDRVSLDGNDATQPLDEIDSEQSAERQTQPIRTTTQLSSASGALTGETGAPRRRGPSTAVFGRDFAPDDDPHTQAAATAEMSATTPTASITPAVTEPVAAAPIASADEPDLIAAARAAGAGTPAEVRSASNGFRLTPLKMVLFLLLIGAIAAGAILARGYFQETKTLFEQSPDGMKVNRDERRKKIDALHESLGEFKKKLYQSSDTRRREELENRLNDVKKELDYADQLLAEDKFQEVDSALKKVDNLIGALAEEIRNLTMISPAHKVGKAPARI